MLAEITGGREFHERRGLMTTRGPLANLKHGVIDIHMHPTLKSFMLGKDFDSRHHPPGFFFPLTMRTDLDALLSGGVKAFFSTIYMVEHDFLKDVWPIRLVSKVHPRLRHIFGTPADRLVMECLDHQDAFVKKANEGRGEVISVARTYPDMQRIMGEGKIAVLCSVEGAHHLNGNLENVQKFYDRGVCHMIIPHLYPNEACWNVDCFEDKVLLKKLGCFSQDIQMETGLTDFGRELVDLMCDIGMIVDMTHATPQCRAEILERMRNHPKKRPLIMSHVGLHEFMPHPMNPTAAEIRAIADTGGVIGIIAMSYYLTKPEKKDCLETIIKMIDFMIEHGGEEVVAFGSDFDGFTAPPRDFKSPRDYSRIRDMLLRKYRPEQVDKFFSGNADRVLREGWGRQVPEGS